MPIIQQLNRAKVNHLQALIAIMEQYDGSDAEDFAAIIDHALSLGVKQIQIADEFKVSESTVSRWRRGKSLPMSMIRGTVIGKLSAFLNQEIEENPVLVMAQS